jgi:hypothetical protein
MAPITRSKKLKAAGKKRHFRTPSERNYHAAPSNQPPVPRRITRRYAADHAGSSHVILAGPLPMTGPLPEHASSQQPQQLQPNRPDLGRRLPANMPWKSQFARDMAPAYEGGHDRSYQAVPPQGPLQAAHNAAMLQLAARQWIPMPGGNPAAGHPPPPSWRATDKGPQAVPITRIVYGLLTDAAGAGPDELGTLWVNVGLQTATTVHRDNRAGPEGCFFSTLLYTSSLRDSHPLLLRAPPVVRPWRLIPPGHGHALLPADDPLLVRPRLENARWAAGPLVCDARPLLENPRWRIETGNANMVRAHVARKLWGERRGRIRGGKDVPWAGGGVVDGGDYDMGDLNVQEDTRGNNGSRGGGNHGVANIPAGAERGEDRVRDIAGGVLELLRQNEAARRRLSLAVDAFTSRL